MSVTVYSKSQTVGGLEVAPRILRVFTGFLCFYLAAPVFDVPFVGLSLSALAIFFLFFEVMIRFGGLRLHQTRILLGLLLIIWFAQLGSLAFNEIFTNNQVNLGVGLTTLYRYGFWFFVFLLGVRLFSTSDLPQIAIIAFGLGIILLALMVLIEFYVFGGLSLYGMSNLTGLSQNSYGWQFSAFVPASLYLIMISKGKWRVLAGAAFVLVILAVMINASRSSWMTTATGLSLFAVLWMVSSPRKIGTARIVLGMVVLLVVCYGVFSLLPSRLKIHMEKRIVQSENIEMDKSWQTRVVLVGKGKKIFWENPLFGVGPGQFRYTQVKLDLPYILSSASEEALNRKSSHNSYIQLLAEGGVTLMIPYLVMLGYLFVFGLKAALYLARKGETWGIPVFVGLVGFSIHFWSLSGITSTSPWFLYGLVAAMIFRQKFAEKHDLKLAVR